MNNTLIKDNFCPCNSGKLYENCCKENSYQYECLGKNYEGRDIIFNNTKNMNIYDDITDFAMNKIFSLEGQAVLFVSKALELLGSIYKKVDEGIEQFSAYAPCKKGCSTCCSLYLDCTAIEAENIRRYVIENKTEEEIEKIKNKLTYMKGLLTTTPRPYELDERELDDLYLTYASKHIPCMFLNDEGACSIYEVRPLSCRKFIVFSSADKCKNNASEIIKPNVAPANIGSLTIDYLSMYTGRYKNLIYLQKGEKKPIKRPLIEWFSEDFKDIIRDI